MTEAAEAEVAPIQYNSNGFRSRQCRKAVSEGISTVGFPTPDVKLISGARESEQPGWAKAGRVAGWVWRAAGGSLRFLAAAWSGLWGACRCACQPCWREDSPACWAWPEPGMSALCSHATSPSLTILPKSRSSSSPDRTLSKAYLHAVGRGHVLCTEVLLCKV